LKAGYARDPDKLVNELQAMVRQQIGAVAALKRAAAVSQLPKTRSGKILRRTIRKIADGESYAVPPTLDDPRALGEMKRVFRAVD
jgi:propionyl-CoA synthetase